MKISSFLLVLVSITICFSFNSEKKQEFKGLWKSIGYGRILDVGENQVKVYDVNTVSCIPYYYPEKIDEFLVENTPKLSHSDTMIVHKGITTYKYYRINKLPKICSGEPYNSSPIFNFDSYWETFKHYYPYFEERGMDWDNIKKKYRPKINDKTTELELLIILDNIHKELNDDHTNFTWVPNKLEKEYEQSLKGDSNEKPINIDSLWSSGMVKTADRVLTKVNYYNDNGVIWGVTDNNLGYIQINRMWGFADYGISSSLKGDKFWNKYEKKAKKSKNSYHDNNNEGIKKLMGTILKNFEGTDGVIIDIRFNRGGSDAIALNFLSYFNDSSKTAFSKKAKMGDSFTKTQSIKLESKPNAYTKKVVLLTSHETCSAAEIFALASLSLPHVTRIGNNTSGHFSDAITKATPNGWTFRMSMEVYLDQQKKNYEVIGIPPDIKTESTSKALFENLLENKTDAAMIKAIEILRK